jgi:uracil phosphoribosyltransferase
MTSPLPSNVHVSAHPCLQAKLSQLRSAKIPAAEVKSLVHEITLLLGCDALAKAVTSVPGPKDVTSLGYEFTSTQIEPQSMCIVPILRSGLGMVEAVQTLLPRAVPVHHLGIYREATTLSPVEYYNNLPNLATTPGAKGSSLVIIVDPIIATGGTCVAAIQMLREWGAQRILVLSVLANVQGLERCAAEWPEGTELWVAGVDEEITPTGMLKPGVGDIGDRLFLTIGK